MNRAGKWFWTLVAVQTLFLLVWAGYHEFVRQHAPVLLLKGRPVDPQDLLRGDYLTMNYDITEVPFQWHESDVMDNIPGDIWVLLEKRDQYYVAVRGERLRPHDIKPGQILVRGTIDRRWQGPGKPKSGPVNYGIEKYFVPEGKGSPRFKLMEVEVSVSPAHRLYIKRVLLDGQAFP